MQNKKIIRLFCFDIQGRTLNEPLEVEVDSFDTTEVANKSKNSLSSLGLPLSKVYNPSPVTYSYKDKTMIEATNIPILTEGKPLSNSYEWAFIKDMSLAPSSKEQAVKAFEQVYQAGGFPNVLNPGLYTSKIMEYNN